MEARVGNARIEPAGTRPRASGLAGSPVALIAMAELPVGHVRNCQELGKTHDSLKLLLARCIAAAPAVTIHMDGKEMAGRWWTDGPG